MEELTEKEIEELLSRESLSFDNLKYLASETSKNTWSTYSHFPVGAAVVGINKENKLKVFTGTNVEPTVHQNVCAERVAIYNGISAGYKKFIAVAISIPKAEEQVANPSENLNNFTPCGACREVLLQKMDPKGLIVVGGLERSFRSRELLPKPILDTNKLKALSIEEMDTLELARKALHNAYVPFSKDKYGVSLLSATGKTFSSSTIDSAALSCSSEPLRAVIGSLTASEGNPKGKIKSIAFAYPLVKYPSGDLLQLISDYCSNSTKIIIDNMGVTTIEDLLPYAFKLN